MADISKQVQQLKQHLAHCRLCPRQCNINRQEGELGYCKTGTNLKIFCCNLHQGEEPPIVGTKGSGTIFFSGCNLRCVYCQNFAFSQNGNGKIYTINELSDEMLALQKRGAANINWVTATPQLPMAVAALEIARQQGLTIPLVYNSSGYESLEIIKILDGIVDIYLPDAKYDSPITSQEYSDATDYPAINMQVLKEMYRQVGPLKLNEGGIAVKGMLIRHLVLPNHADQSCRIIKKLATELGTEYPISVMCQYFPTHKAKAIKKINRQISWDEYIQVLECLDQQEYACAFIQELE